MSLPVRERGLKSMRWNVAGGGNESLPVRERGLKLRVRGDALAATGRSPCGSVD